MNRLHAIAFLATLSLCACHKASAPAADPNAPAAPQTAIGKIAAKGIAEARKELQTKNLTLNGDGGININGRRYGGRNDPSLPKAEITPQGDLLIDGKAVAITPEQRKQLLDYRSNLLGVAEAGMTVGLKGADLAGKALTESLGSILSGDTDEFEKKMEAEGKKLEADAMQICAHLGPMLVAQDKLAASLPEFKPYATMTQEDVDDCGKDHKGAAAFSDEDRAKLQQEVRDGVRDAVRGGAQAATEPKDTTP
ncbi:hypothetical protein J5837_12335 [Pseudoxanthomonas helianthi]|uniref:DUF2884 family protein n=1 Tax=Pseudoxanthomonas helianthi TaxID=1453541 RepID=A0A940X6J6_9GAMM|nr:hypothetical protein [Pseudoxanthomonas helianthi]MBP3985195.1 hypothetical protein [Pseudoxanthomonas helianthi]